MDGFEGPRAAQRSMVSVQTVRNAPAAQARNPEWRLGMTQRRWMLLPIGLTALAIVASGCATDRGETSSPRSLPTYPSPSPQGGLDKLFYRGGLRLSRVHVCRLAVCRVASDHLPLLAEFELR